jgi:hypothetical protein
MTNEKHCYMQHASDCGVLLTNEEHCDLPGILCSGEQCRNSFPCVGPAEEYPAPEQVKGQFGGI